MKNKLTFALKRLLPPLLAAGLLYLAARFAVPFLLPFLLALLFASLLERPVGALYRCLGLRRAYSAALAVLLLLGLLLALLFFLGTRLLSAAGDFAAALPERLAALSAPFQGVEGELNAFVDSLPPDTAKLCRTALDSLRGALGELPAALYGTLLSALSGAAAKAPSLLFLFFSFALALFYLTEGWPEVRSFLYRQVPAPLRERAGQMKRDVCAALGQWAGAQLKLMGITFVELSLAFLFLGVDRSMLAAAAVALVDALPLLGTGTVLLPWALGSLLLGETRRAVFLSLTWALVSLVRSLLEPKLIGSRSGLHPVAALLALYCGARLAGVWGMLLFPPSLLILKQLNDRGWIRLWR